VIEESMLSIKVLELSVILVGRITCGRTRWEPTISKKEDISQFTFDFRR
jgi:hypothetical protein